MKKRIFYCFVLSVAMTGMTSCGSKSSKTAEETDIVEDTTTITEAMVDTATVPEIPMDSPSGMEDIVTVPETGELNIEVSPGKRKTREVGEGWNATMTLTVKNLSDSPVSGSDYSISYKSKEWGGGSEDPYSKTVTKSANGIDLGPNETGHITISRMNSDKFYDFKVKDKR